MSTNSFLINSVETEEELKECLTNNKYLIVKASAQWCNPCKRIEQSVNELFRNRLEHNVKVMYLDIDDSEDVANYLSITKIPAFYTFVNGKLDSKEVTSNMNDIQAIVDRVNSHSILG